MISLLVILVLFSPMVECFGESGVWERLFLYYSWLATFGEDGKNSFISKDSRISSPRATTPGTLGDLKLYMDYIHNNRGNPIPTNFNADSTNIDEWRNFLLKRYTGTSDEPYVFERIGKDASYPTGSQGLRKIVGEVKNYLINKVKNVDSLTAFRTKAFSALKSARELRIFEMYKNMLTGPNGVGMPDALKDSITATKSLEELVEKLDRDADKIIKAIGEAFNGGQEAKIINLNGEAQTIPFDTTYPAHRDNIITFKMPPGFDCQ
ncbi:hypothetical protein SAMD00019534_113370 [Acytostelium subglobosum LB1]|uniref:hypothetical protein n=1 Tax=Acytostelium subglobosum LB1 TaxID=1410327 RepID=UPI000645032F|nr:hypothetical protein SAMD00019534_113370 [Acytostelium subglobosum LB1]GAM28161.1 hypothetical protein SAMD00019534_113370 [Acytostelium subglobosum LB1]|eukprot:XP_012748795.1 hypothetical protein SAMD00019534_113370 [Acytostelium subglobosum LB1]